MRTSNVFVLLIIGFYALFQSAAYAAVSPTALEVKVSKTCVDNQGVTIRDCFTTMPDVIEWMATIRKPNVMSPLFVSIGPGAFGNNELEYSAFDSGNLRITCDAAAGYTGYTSFKGAGSSATKIVGIGGNDIGILTVDNCTNLNFSDFRIVSGINPFSEATPYGGIYWFGGGDSTWTNIEILVHARGWVDKDCSTSPGNHYWFNSKISVENKVGVGTAYKAECDESWFYGSEVELKLSAFATPKSYSTINANNDGILHLYGSTLRVIADISQGSSASAASAGLGEGSNLPFSGEIHMHGTSIELTSNTGNNLTALRVGNTGFIHADASTYTFNTGGTKERIYNNGTGIVKAAYQWPASAEPPIITSVNGADLFIEKNCDNTGCSSEITGDDSHLMIYNDNCDYLGPWFDVVTKACRGDQTILEPVITSVIASGPSGNWITVTGENFKYGATVLVNGASPWGYQVNGDTSMTVLHSLSNVSTVTVTTDYGSVTWTKPVVNNVVTGTVKKQDGSVFSNVTFNIHNAVGEVWVVTTNSSGVYSRSLPNDTYVVDSQSISGYNLLSVVGNGSFIIEDNQVTKDLIATPRGPTITSVVASGPSGNWITVNGERFKYGATVLVNGASPWGYQVNGDTSVTVLHSLSNVSTVTVTTDYGSTTWTKPVVNNVVTGTVKKQDGSVFSNVTFNIHNAVGEVWVVTTNSSGVYSRSLPNDTYVVDSQSISGYNLLSVVGNGSFIIEDNQVTKDLIATPRGPTITSVVASGPSGNWITVTGERFKYGATVLVNGASPWGYQVNGDTSITVLHSLSSVSTVTVTTDYGSVTWTKP